MMMNPTLAMAIRGKVRKPAERQRQQVGNGQADKVGNDIAPIEQYIHDGAVYETLHHHERGTCSRPSACRESSYAFTEAGRCPMLAIECEPRQPRNGDRR